MMTMSSSEHWTTQQVASLHNGFHMVSVHIAPTMTERGTIHAYISKYRRVDDTDGVWHNDIRSAVKALEGRQ